ncbi:MAG: hypothetical protein ACOC34_04830 [Thermotogota bacterium]
MFITFLVIFSLICSISFSDNTIITENGYKIFLPSLPYFLKNVSPFSLGSITDPELLFDFGLLLAKKAKTVNAHACVIGYSQLLSRDSNLLEGHFDEQIAPFFSIDPYKASQTIEWIANGLTAGGIFPVLSAKFGLSDTLILNLKHRMIYPAILLESYIGEEQTFKEMKLAIINDSGSTQYYPELLKKLDWKWPQQIKDEEILRQELLIASIIQLKKRFTFKDYDLFHTPLTSTLTDRSVVFVKDPRIIDLNKFSTGYLIHSTEDFILEQIRLICSEIYYARGSKNW